MRHLPALWALAFAAATTLVHVLLGREASIIIAAIVIAMVGAIYVGFALADGRPATIVIESLVASLFGAAAYAGIRVSPWFIVAATAAHAAWDLLHHRSHLHAAPPTPLARVPHWYIPYCVIYDLLAAAILAVLWFSRGYFSR